MNTGVESSTYIKPQDVGPREWVLSKVLREGEAEDWAAADGEWMGEPRLALRWNGTKEKRLGNPQSSANATWFIVPSELEPAVREAIREFLKQQEY